MNNDIVFTRKYKEYFDSYFLSKCCHFEVY